VNAARLAAARPRRGRLLGAGSRTVWGACVLAALGSAVYLLAQPATADLAAQEYRAGLVRKVGLGLWDNGWFAGHHTPAYSLLFPPLGALLGVRVAGVLAAVAAAALFALLAERHWSGRAATVAAGWFTAGILATLASGRLTFLLGVAVALAALLALQRSRRAVAVALALLTSVASPVAGLFLALAAVAWALAHVAPGCAPARGGAQRTTPAGATVRRDPRRLWGAAIAAGALAPAAALGLLFPEGGSEPFVASAFWPGLAGIALLGFALPTRERTLRIGAAIYGLMCVAAFLIATPLGGNATRLGALIAGPVLAGALLAARLRTTGVRAPAALLALALPLTYWQLYPAVRDVARASGDPSTQARYHAPLIRFLQRRPGTFRVEIPFTANHWEAAYVAPKIALARGWERQLDRRDDALFYGAPLNPATYRAWLDANAVAYVAVPDVPLDYSARGEAKLVANGLAYLRPVWHNAHWRVFAVRHATPLVEGAAAAIALEPDGFTITARRRGEALVRIRHTRWWTVTAGRACVQPGPGGMTRVHVLRPGTVHVQARLTGGACRR
jgi:hypothetical protein